MIVYTRELYCYNQAFYRMKRIHSVCIVVISCDWSHHMVQMGSDWALSVPCDYCDQSQPATQLNIMDGMKGSRPLFTNCHCDLIGYSDHMVPTASRYTDQSMAFSDGHSRWQIVPQRGPMAFAQCALWEAIIWRPPGMTNILPSLQLTIGWAGSKWLKFQKEAKRLIAKVWTKAGVPALQQWKEEINKMLLIKQNNKTVCCR